MNIVYATDGSIGSVVAGDLLARLALEPGDRIEVLAFCGDESASERVTAGPREALHGTRAVFSFRTLSGDLAQQLLQAVSAMGADLVVLGAISEPGPGRSFTWPLVERLVRHSPASILIARPPAYGLARTLAAVDPSPAAARVVEVAAAFPLPPASELRLVTVLPPEGSAAGIAPVLWSSLSGELEHELRAQWEAAESHLREMAAPLREAGRLVSAEVMRGEPGAALVTLARSETADLVVVGSRPERSVDLLVLGSVAGHVARHAACSVLVAR